MAKSTTAGLGALLLATLPTNMASAAGAASPAASPALPLALVLDRRGHVAFKFEGRVPAEAWNDIADLVE